MTNKWNRIHQNILNLASWVINSWGFCVGIKRKFINLVNLPSIKSVAFLSPFWWVYCLRMSVILLSIPLTGGGGISNASVLAFLFCLSVN